MCPLIWLEYDTGTLQHNVMVGGLEIEGGQLFSHDMDFAGS